MSRDCLPRTIAYRLPTEDSLMPPGIKADLVVPPLRTVRGKTITRASPQTPLSLIQKHIHK